MKNNYFLLLDIKNLEINGLKFQNYYLEEQTIVLKIIGILPYKDY